MVRTSKILAVLFIVLELFLPGQDVWADTGPKPSMEFEFHQELDGGPLTIVSGTLYECRQSDCSDAVPLDEVGPQDFHCNVDRCYAQAYGFAPYHRI